MLVLMLGAAVATIPPNPTAQATTAPATAPVVAAPDTPFAVEESWTANAEAPLSATLAGWADRAGWKLVWESDTDFRLAAGATIAGDFPTAAERLLGAFSHTSPHLKATFYNGNKVLRVWTERNEP